MTTPPQTCEVCMCERGRERSREGCGGGECVRVRQREGYPLHCCVTGNLIEREREGGRALSKRRCWDYRRLGQAVAAARPSLQSVRLGGGGAGGG